MRPRVPFSALMSLGFLSVACGDSASTPGLTESPGTTSPASTGDAPPSGGTTTEDTGESPLREPCDRYLACVSAVAPGELPTAQMGFGESGTCWQGSEADAQLCLDACKAGLETFNEAFPDEPKCAVCQGHAECDADAGELCYRGKCTVTTCSDGIVDPEEVCDSQMGCDVDCLGPLECNPFSNFNCLQTEECVVIFETDGAPSDAVSTTRCVDWFTSDGRTEGEPCGLDHCAMGLGCASDDLLPACEPGGAYGCCTPLCMLDNPTQCSDDEKCVPYKNPFGPPTTPALGYLGSCVAK